MVELTASLRDAARRNALLIVALALTSVIAAWGLFDTNGLAAVAETAVDLQFQSRAWFVMLTVTFLLIASGVLAFSKWSNVRLGADHERPEFSTVTWLAMLFAAGMGVGLLYWGSAEPLSHYGIVAENSDARFAADRSLFLTNFHWGLHAWAIYAMTGLVIAYFAFRRGTPTLVSAPIVATLGKGWPVKAAGWICDLFAIVAIAIGLGGSVAMGVLQVAAGVESVFGTMGSSLGYAVLALLALTCVPPLVANLGNGMGRLSNAAMGIAIALMLFVLIAGPTSVLMSTIVGALASYVSGVIPQGLRTYSFMNETVSDWFQDWTLTYMVWWIAWAPFVGVFIARISRGRTIREFLLGVILVPSGFSILWFGVFGGIGFHGAFTYEAAIFDMAREDPEAVTFFVLDRLPLTTLTSLAVIVAAFLFVLTSLVSAAFVLGMFSTGGDLDPSRRVRLSWGGILLALGLVMLLTGDIGVIRTIIALGALPFVFVVLLLSVCFLKTLQKETITP